MSKERYSIKRNAGEVARELISGMVRRSVMSIRGDIPNELATVVNNLNFDRSHIPEIVFKTGTLFRSDYINNILDLIYTDIVVQYNDIFHIQDSLKQLRNHFDTVIMSKVKESSETANRVRNYKALSERHFQFTDTIYESFLGVSNRSHSSYACRVNNNAGIVTLPAIIEEYADETTADIDLRVLSNNVRIVDKSESDRTFSDDMTDPFFITAIAGGSPENDEGLNLNIMDRGHLTGVLIDVAVKFKTRLPVTQVRFKPFSTAPIDVVGVYYSIGSDPDWYSPDIRLARIVDFDHDTDEIEINFPRIHAREVHIVLHQTHYNTVKSEIKLLNALDTEEHIRNTTNRLEHIMPDGFIETDNLEMQISEVSEFLKRNANPGSHITRENSKIFVAGLCDLEINNCSYLHFGDYIGRTRKLDGPLHAVSSVQSGSLTRVQDEEGIVDSCTLFSVRISNTNIYLGHTLEDGRVTDGNIVEVNYIFSEESTVKDDDYPYMFETHFRTRLEPEDMNMDIYSNGIRIELPEDAIYEYRNFSTVIKLPSYYCEEHNISEGDVFTFVYATESYDSFGNPYNTYQAIIEDRVGKPNITVGEVVNINDSYLYVPRPHSERSYSQYAPDEWDKVSISGEIFYRLNEDKDLTQDDTDIIENDNTWYASQRVVSGPFDNMYYGMVNEKPEVILQEEGDYKTDKPYMKGSLKVFVDEHMLRPETVGEYPDDIPGSIVPNENRVYFKIDPIMAESDIRVSYIPIYPSHYNESTQTIISQHNRTDRFNRTEDNAITLTAYPFFDIDIISSDMFDFKDGVFNYKWRYSVIYEPVVVYVNGVKAINITEFREGMRQTPTFRPVYRDEFYQFYIEGGNRLVFDREIHGSVIVYYYYIDNYIRERLEMIRSNHRRDDISPELYNYTILADIQR